MKHIELVGALFELDGKSLTLLEENPIVVSCKGNACGDIDYQWNDDTNSYHFFNDGSEKLELKVTSASYFGCGPYSTRRMRPGQSWDTGFFGICEYEANYR